MTEEKLFGAFDLQRFSGNERLQAVIDAAHKRCLARELIDDELDLVAAAGALEKKPDPKEFPK